MKKRLLTLSAAALLLALCASAVSAQDKRGPSTPEERAQTVRLAGVEGMLKAYEGFLKAKPKGHHKFLDELIEKRDKGELAAWVADVTRNKCSGPKTKME